MNQLFYYDSIDQHPLYNCSALTAEKIALSHSIQRPYWGIAIILYGIISQTLYVLSLKVIVMKANFSLSCYKIMLILGLNDMLSSINSNIILGYCIYAGISFCDAPSFIYATGCVHYFCFVTSGFFGLLLALNRSLEVSKHKALCYLKVTFFDGDRTYFSIAFGIIYSFVLQFFGKAALFNNTFGCFHHDPLIFDDRSEEYKDYIMIINNLFVFILAAIFTIFYFYTILKRIELFANFSTQRRIFTQALALNMLTWTVAFAYFCIIFSLIEFDPFIEMVMYEISTGLPAIIYVTINHTIKQGVKKDLQYILKLCYNYPKKILGQAAITPSTTTTTTGTLPTTKPPQLETSS